MNLRSQHDDYMTNPIKHPPKPLTGSRIKRSDDVLAEGVPLIQGWLAPEKRSDPHDDCITGSGMPPISTFERSRAVAVREFHRHQAGNRDGDEELPEDRF
jgi:hypothetical protein